MSEEQNQNMPETEVEVSPPVACDAANEFGGRNPLTMTDEELDALYEETLRNFKEGEVVKGRVVEILDDFVVVDIGYKSEGSIRADEFPDHRVLEIGQELDVFIDEPEDEDGMPVLSKIKADKIKNWTHIQNIYEEDGVIEGRIIRRVKGGLKVDIGIDAFMPASQLTWRPTSDLDKYIGQTMEMKIIKLTKRRRNVVVSRRKLLEEQRAGEKNRLLSTIEEGQVIPGEVKNITDFGAFVDVGGIDGLLHVTDMSWGRVKHPSQIVSVGEKIEVMILSFDPKTERISLGLKQKTPNPWETAEERYPPGSIATGRVVSMTDYGAFVQLEDGIEGMVHVSEMSWTRRVRHPNELLNMDDEVDVMIMVVDAEAQKIQLGIKQTRPNPWNDLEARFPVGSIVKGIVRNMTDYGAFIEIEDGIDALLHVSDLSWTRKVAHPNEILERGQEIVVKVMSIDTANEKISVGLKQIEPDPWQQVVDNTPIGAHVEVEVAKLVSFGAFARLSNGVEGLVHVSELADERVQKPEEVLNVGDKVMAKVISIDPVERKIGLSVREYLKDKERGQATSTASGATPGMVSIGDVIGDAMPKSFLQNGQDPSLVANQMMADAGNNDDIADQSVDITKAEVALESSDSTNTAEDAEQTPSESTVSDAPVENAPEADNTPASTEENDNKENDAN